MSDSMTRSQVVVFLKLFTPTMIFLAAMSRGVKGSPKEFPTFKNQDHPDYKVIFETTLITESSSRHLGVNPASVPAIV